MKKNEMGDDKSKRNRSEDVSLTDRRSVILIKREFIHLILTLKLTLALRLTRTLTLTLPLTLTLTRTGTLNVFQSPNRIRNLSRHLNAKTSDDRTANLYPLDTAYHIVPPLLTQK